MRRLLALFVVALALGVAAPAALAKPHADVLTEIADDGPITPGAGVGAALPRFRTARPARHVVARPRQR